MSKMQPMTAPAAPAVGAPAPMASQGQMATPMQPAAAPTVTGNPGAIMASPNGNGGHRDEAFKRGVQRTVSHSVDAHAVKRMRGGC